MSPADIDPSLRTGEPQFERLDDGFSPPPHEAPRVEDAGEPVVAADPVLGAKSLF